MKKRITNVVRAVAGLTALVLGVTVTSTVWAQNQTWTDGAANMLWDTTSANWSPGPTWNNAVPDSAIFGNTGAGAVSVVGTNDFNWMYFVSGSYDFTNGTLALDGPASASIITNNATEEIDSALVDGPSGSSQLVLDGGGTLTLTGAGTNTYSGGTVVNGGTLDCGPALSPYGDVIGTLTVNNGALVNLDVDYSLGANNTAGTAKCTNIVINGSTLAFVGQYYNNFFNGGISPSQITLNGGSILANETPNGNTGQNRQEFDWNGGTAPVLYVLASSTTSLIGALMDVTLGSTANSLTVNVAKGTTPSGIDLLDTNQISDNGGANLVFTGTGVSDLTGLNNLGSAYGNGGGALTTCTVSGGTLLVDGSMDIAATMNLNGGLTAGEGVIWGPLNDNSGGTLGAGDLGGISGIGMLTISNAVTLNGGSKTYLRLSKNGGVITNDTLLVSTIAYGGTLVVSNITSDLTALAVGDTATLFIAPVSGDYSGAFTNFVLPTLPAGWTWDTSGLLINGSIQVINTAATPAFSPLPGFYSGAQNVTVSCSTAGSTIYYTTNGSPPTSGSPNGASPINVGVPANTTMTIKAYATSPGFTQSGVASGTFTTVTPVPAPIAMWQSLASPGSWASIGNWSNYFVANNTLTYTNVTADFSELSLTQNMNVTLDGNWTIGSLVSGDQGSTYNWKITPGSGSQIVLNNNSNAPSVITVNNGSNSITAVLAGLNGLTVNGKGVLALTAPETSPNTYSNGTVVNGSLFVSAGGKLGIIWGPLTINSNATVYANRGWSFGYNTPAGGFTTNGGSHRGVTSITINPGGTLQWLSDPSGSGGFAGNVITMTGGTNTGNTQWDWTGDGYANYAGHAQFNVIASPWTAMVTGGTLNERCGNSGTNSSGIICFNVGKGTTPSGIDLEWTVPIGNGNGGNICMSGPGTMQIASSASTILSTANYNNWVMVSNGVLLVECNVGAHTYGAVYGGVLGGNGTFNNSVTNYSGGTIEPGDLATNVGELAVYGNLVLEPGSTVLCRINQASTSGYTYDNVYGPLMLNYGGTLIVTNVSGVPNNADLVVGDSFYLFQLSGGGTYVGNITALQCPQLGPGEAWSWAPGSGTLSIVPSPGPVQTPVLVSFGPWSNGSFPLTFSGENGHNYYVLTTTNLALPLAQWTVLNSGTFFGSPATFTDASATAPGQRFYKIESQ